MSAKEIIEALSVPGEMPALALRGLVVFPDMMLQFDVGRKKSIAAIQTAMEQKQMIFLVAQKDLSEDDPAPEGLFEMGVVARIKQVLHHSEEGVRIYVEGLYRAKLLEVVRRDPCMMVQLEVLPRPVQELDYRQSPRAEALIRSAQSLFEEYIRSYRHVPPDIIMRVIQEKDCGRLADFIASNLPLDFELKQEILSELHPLKRIKRLTEILREEIKILAIEAEINEKTREQMDENQRNYYLREQMRIISEELGEEDNPQEEAEEFRSRIKALKLPEEQEEKLLKECDRLFKMPFGSHEASVIRGYLETCLELPWNTLSREHIDIAKAKRVLDRDHYGLDKVKERILETLAVRKLTQEPSGQILCLVGPPGVGKTSIAKSIAKAIGRKYVRVSLGGVRDDSDIVGHRAFQNFQQGLLHAFAADIPGNRGVFRLPGDLVNLIHIDDAALCPFHIKVRRLDQTEEDILHVFTHIAGLCQGGGIGNGKGNVQHPGQCLGQKSLAHAGGAQQQHVALIDVHALFAVINTLIVVVHCHRQHHFRTVLANYIFVQHCLDLPGFGKNQGGRRLPGRYRTDSIALFQDGIAQLNAGIANIHPRAGNHAPGLVFRLAAEGTADPSVYGIVVICHFITNPKNYRL